MFKSEIIYKQRKRKKMKKNKKKFFIQMTYASEEALRTYWPNVQIKITRIMKIKKR